ncbi:MAG: hypothetical protein QGG36_20905 [Pirellulaceae bacterium]|jgi:porin|nr:hypothetical protein [Pirellulaceae bacterium]
MVVGRAKFHPAELQAVVVIIWLFTASTIPAQQSGEAEVCDAELVSELLSLDSGECQSYRSHLTGDWHGQRPCFAENGITFTGDVTQYYSGVTTGGRERRFLYGGHADYVLDFDMDKLAGAPGMFVKVRGESQFGQFSNSDTGAILAATTSGLLPTPGEHQTALTEFTIMQALSEQFALFAGELQTFDGDKNAFAHGRGKTQFMNVGLAANPIAFRTVPYSSLGAGFVIMRDLEPTRSRKTTSTWTR